MSERVKRIAHFLKRAPGDWRLKVFGDVQPMELVEVHLRNGEKKEMRIATVEYTVCTFFEPREEREERRMCTAWSSSRLRRRARLL